MDSSSSLQDLRLSFWYGSRSNLNFKFARDLSDSEFSDFIGQLLDAVGETIDDGSADRVIDVVYRWQIKAYAGHLGDPEDFPHGYDNVPFAELDKPLAESRVLLLTSSGHFVDGDDPEPFGEPNMTQAEAESRIQDFIKSRPELSQIPTTTPPDQIRVRHGGYPVEAAQTDSQVALPIGHLKELERQGVIGELAPVAYSFVGATSQLRLKKGLAQEWAEVAMGHDADAALLVPV
ncbi:MAG: glycine/sarcosine/betaine reductase selenoprotein B family protein [Acidimicrobiales bacterium]